MAQLWWRSWMVTGRIYPLAFILHLAMMATCEQNSQYLHIEVDADTTIMATVIGVPKLISASGASAVMASAAGVLWPSNSVYKRFDSNWSPLTGTRIWYVSLRAPRDHCLICHRRFLVIVIIRAASAKRDATASTLSCRSAFLSTAVLSVLFPHSKFFFFSFFFSCPTPA